MAPALPVFAGEPAPTDSVLLMTQHRTCGRPCATSARRSFRISATSNKPIGGCNAAPFPQSPGMAPALPVFAGEPAPTGSVLLMTQHRTCGRPCATSARKSFRISATSNKPIGGCNAAPFPQSPGMAPALPVFAGEPVPTGSVLLMTQHRTCGSGFTREAFATEQGRCSWRYHAASGPVVLLDDDAPSSTGLNTTIKSPRGSCLEQ
ncbi:hypothetical protein IEC33019_2026 [Pseudomonas putida]|uniref:Uncharacterized protein n=1 Tax=Pseudomonas putida TaxID=303 RepID=A0A1B2F5V8_PSEPU|nr:hypothetical protein IEC33019_2026 [Pseudomonas putida]